MSALPGTLSAMQPVAQDLCELLVQCDALRFGDFVAKSGRRTPYFIDLGRVRTGTQLARLADLYARTLQAHWPAGFDVLFGPAYKGIPLCSAVAVALARDHGRDVGFCFDRKEAKDHGEGGTLVGHRPQDGDRIVIIEDVVTAGTSVRHTVPLLRAAARVQIAGLVVAVDRRERGTGEGSALSELGEELGISVVAIANIDEILEYLRGREIGGRVLLDEPAYARALAYRAEHGAT